MTPRSPRTAAHPPHKEGSRFHVVSYHGGYRNGKWTSWLTCSEPRCEINKRQP